jgi:hypothetical protein
MATREHVARHATRAGGGQAEAAAGGGGYDAEVLVAPADVEGRGHRDEPAVGEAPPGKAAARERAGATLGLRDPVELGLESEQMPVVVGHQAAHGQLPARARADGVARLEGGWMVELEDHAVPDLEVGRRLAQQGHEVGGGVDEARDALRHLLGRERAGVTGERVVVRDPRHDGPGLGPAVDEAGPEPRLEHVRGHERPRTLQRQVLAESAAPSGVEEQHGRGTLAARISLRRPSPAPRL